MTDSLPRFLTRAQVAKELGISAWSAYRLIRLGRLRAIKVGQQWRVGRHDLDEYLKRLTTQS